MLAILKTVVSQNDPYPRHIEATVNAINTALGNRFPSRLGYQSKVGPVEWLQPYTEDAIVELAQQGIKDLVVVPISFVSEHIETLEEIDIEYRELAEEAGIHTFNRVPALDTNPTFITALADLILEAATAPAMALSDVPQMVRKTKMYPQEKWEWGLTTAAEVWNGRMAMLGFLLLAIEIVSGRGPLHLAGLL